MVIPISFFEHILYELWERYVGGQQFAFINASKVTVEQPMVGCYPSPRVGLDCEVEIVLVWKIIYFICGDMPPSGLFDFFLYGGACTSWYFPPNHLCFFINPSECVSLTYTLYVALPLFDKFHTVLVILLFVNVWRLRLLLPRFFFFFWLDDFDLGKFTLMLHDHLIHSQPTS